MQPARTVEQDPSAWKGSEYRDREDLWKYTLSGAEAAELLDAVRRCVRQQGGEGQEVTGITREQFTLPGLGPTIGAWAREINDGRGFLLVSGLPASEMSDTELRAAFWGIGLYLGSPVSQNSYGDMFGDVYDQGVKMGTGRVRGYRTNQRLRFHTDRCDIVGLLCVRPARTGGLSSIASSTRVYYEILRHHPEYIAPLMKGYIHANMEEGGHLATRRVPVYSVHEGVVSCRILRNTIENARQMGYATYDDLETRALACMDDMVSDPDFRLDMMLERGDMQFINNYTTLHARTEFEDYPEPEKRRHMVRLWLRSFGLRRPVDRALFDDYDGVEKTLTRNEEASA
jgi:hypothetical protein